MPASKNKTVTALAGGVGASKLLLGLHDVIDPRNLTVIVNTGDDITISPHTFIARRCLGKANR